MGIEKKTFELCKFSPHLASFRNKSKKQHMKIPDSVLKNLRQKQVLQSDFLI